MNDERLKIYLDDQLALIVGEIDLADRCHDSNRGGELGELLAAWCGELKRQHDIVENLLNRLGSSGSLLKQGMAWLAEKAGRFKINDSFLSYSDLSRLIELETLAVGACKRSALWENLNECCSRESRLAGFDFAALQMETQTQIEQMNKLRLDAARQAFGKGNPIT